MVANCILRSVCQFFARPNCAFNLSVFHARISCLCLYKNSPNAWKLPSKTALRDLIAEKRRGKKKNARAAFAPWVAQNFSYPAMNGALSYIRCQFPKGTATNSGPAFNFARRENVQLVRSKRARFHAMRISSECTAEGSQWIGKIFENKCRRFVGVLRKWYNAHLRCTQPMKEQNYNSTDAEK